MGCRISQLAPSLLVLASFAFALSGCGSSSGGVSGLTRNVKLTASQETNGNTSTATGTANVTVTGDRQRIIVTIQTTGLSNVTAIHIHAGLTGTAGLMGEDAPVVFTLYDSASGPFTGTLVKVVSVLDFTAQPGVGINFFSEAIDAIAKGRAYVNIHTSANPTGEIRGQMLPVNFMALMSGANEVPPANVAGKGTATVTIDPSNCTIRISGTTSFLANQSITLGHIHVGAVGVDGPVIFPFFDSTQGAFTGAFDKTLRASDLVQQPGAGIDDCSDAINAILTGNAYVNLHSTDFPGGIIRGQLVVQ